MFLSDVKLVPLSFDDYVIHKNIKRLIKRLIKITKKLLQSD